eukprot:3383824-Amphidinium_carterae.1
MPKDRVPPVPEACSTETGVTESLAEHIPATPKAALQETVPVQEPKSKPPVPTAIINAHTVCSIEPGAPPPPVPIRAVIDEGVDNRPVGPIIFGQNADQAVANYVKQPRSWDQAAVQGPSVKGCSSQGGKGSTTTIPQTEWNMSQWPDPPQQAALVTGQ